MASALPSDGNAEGDDSSLGLINSDLMHVSDADNLLGEDKMEEGGEEESVHLNRDDQDDFDDEFSNFGDVSVTSEALSVPLSHTDSSAETPIFDVPKTSRRPPNELHTIPEEDNNAGGGDRDGQTRRKRRSDTHDNRTTLAQPTTTMVATSTAAGGGGGPTIALPDPCWSPPMKMPTSTRPKPPPPPAIENSFGGGGNAVGEHEDDAFEAIANSHNGSLPADDDFQSMNASRLKKFLDEDAAVFEEDHRFELPPRDYAAVDESSTEHNNTSVWNVSRASAARRQSSSTSAVAPGADWSDCVVPDRDGKITRPVWLDAESSRVSASEVFAARTQYLAEQRAAYRAKDLTPPISDPQFEPDFGLPIASKRSSAQSNTSAAFGPSETLPQVVVDNLNSTAGTLVSRPASGRSSVVSQQSQRGGNVTSNDRPRSTQPNDRTLSTTFQSTRKDSLLPAETRHRQQPIQGKPDGKAGNRDASLMSWLDADAAPLIGAGDASALSASRMQRVNSVLNRAPNNCNASFIADLVAKTQAQMHIHSAGHKPEQSTATSNDEQSKPAAKNKSGNDMPPPARPVLKARQLHTNNNSVTFNRTAEGTTGNGKQQQLGNVSGMSTLSELPVPTATSTPMSASSMSRRRIDIELTADHSKALATPAADKPRPPVSEQPISIRPKSNTSSTAHSMGPLLESNRRQLHFGCQPLHTHVYQELVIKNSARRPVNVNVSLRRANKGFHLGECAKEDDKSAEYVVVLEGHSTRAIPVMFTPTAVCAYQNQLVLRTPANGAKHSIPLFGLGGSAALTVQRADCRVSRTEYTLYVPPLLRNAHLSHQKRIRLTNSGNRDAFAAVWPFADDSQCQPCPHVTFSPGHAFTIPAGRHLDVTINIAPAIWSSQSDEVDLLSQLVVYWGDEIQRQRAKIRKFLGELVFWYGRHATGSGKQPLFNGQFDFVTQRFLGEENHDTDFDSLPAPCDQDWRVFVRSVRVLFVCLRRTVNLELGTTTNNATSAFAALTQLMPGEADSTLQAGRTIMHA